ncbi:MAG TPA: VCBS repeat-containing protein, partial [Opitutaceae bacterium]|nr:VCBS repeat-containing protein [Opitutaceae bacterium]
MTSRPSVFLLALALAAPLFAGTGVASYRKSQLSDQFLSEGAAFGDFNKDGKMDVVSGPYWYAGPDFKQRHEIYPASVYDPLKYSENFFAFTRDFNGDGWADVLILGFPGVDASWFENPGEKGGAWRRHVVYLPVDNESPTFADVLGKGQPALVCMSGGRIGYVT